MKTIEEFLSNLRQIDVKLWTEDVSGASSQEARLRYKAPSETLTPALLQELKERKAEILAFLHQADAAISSQLPPILPTPRDGNLPLSFAQTRLWFLDRLEPDSSAYNIPAAYRLTGVLNIVALEHSLNEIVERHEVLRTTFRSVDGQPSQFIAPSMGFTLPIVDLRDRPENEREAIAQQIANQAAQEPFNLANDPLFRFKFLRLKAAESLLLLNIHHIVSDGWSFDVFFQELTALYTAFSTNKPSPLPALPIQYADFAVWQRHWLQGEVLDSQLNYWKQQLGGNLPVLQLPTDFPRPKVQTYRGAYQTRSLSPDLSKALKALSQREGATLFMTLLAAFKILLHRYSGQTDIIVGTPIAGRNRKEIEELIGFFVNSLVLRTNLEDDPNFRELLGRVREVTLGAYAHQDLPFEKLVEELQPERDPLRTPLFQVWFNMINLADTKLELSGLTVERLENQETPSKFDLTLYIQEKTRGIELELVYNAELFAPERMVEMLHQFQHLLLQIVESPEEKIADFSLVTAKAELLLPNPSQTLTSAREEAVHTRFSRQARLVPKHLAVVDARVAWSYAELDRSANQLANYLLGKGIGSQDIVAIYGNRSASLVWAVLGVLKAGAAFVILDPAYPVAHQIDRLCIAKPRGWLQIETDSSLPTDLEEFVKTLSCFSLQLPQGSIALAGDRLKGYSIEDPAVAVDPDNLAYVTFTSGTTGKPKGILGTHRPLSHFLQWHCQTFDLNQSDRFSLLSGLSHDPLLRDIFTPLWLGATLCIPEPKDLETPGRLAQWMGQQKVSITHLTPAMGQLLTENTLTTSEISSLRYVFFGGDLLTKGDVAKIRKLAPIAICVNFYGATETPQAMGYFPLSNSFDKNGHSYSESLQESIPLGTGIEGVQLLILNTAQQLAGIGEVGEIYIRTPYLAKGYIGDRQLTTERFILNPFTKTIGDRLYKTGDLARYLPDGNIEFLDRLDNQVKIRGFRIELGEVESTLSQYPTVQQCVVTARIDRDSDKRLVAYIVANQQQKPTTDELRRFLKQQLPDYMVPSAFVFLDTLPVTPNGKIDRRALPAPDRLRQEPASTFVLPSDDLEIQLTKIWEQVLGKKPIGVKDNFFDLGGHSLLAVRLFAEIEKTFEKNLPLATLFQAPTVEELASILRQKGWSAPWQTLVAIQPGGSKPPLFCIHPVGGNVLCYHTLANYLGEEQPVYGIQAVGLDGKQAPYQRIEDMAAHYIREIRAFQLEGPYLLAGHSSAGMVAFEMAQQLVAEGQKVAVLALLDAYSPKLFVREVPPGRTLYINLRNLFRLRPEDKLAYIKQRALWLRGRTSNKIAETFNLWMGRSLTQDSHPYALITEAFSQAMRDYVPQVYPGQATLFRTRHQPTKVYYEPQFGWGSLVAGGLEIHDVPGLHLTMLTEPCVQVLGENLRACIDEAIADNSYQIR